MGGDRFIHLFLVVIISQYMHISKHHIVYLKYTQFSFAINKQTRWREVIAKALVPFSGLVCRVLSLSREGEGSPREWL